MPRVLIADDEPNIAELLAVILDHHGFETSICLDAASTAERFAAFAADLIIMDVALGVADGLDLAAQLCAWRPRMHMIILSGNADIWSLAERVKQQFGDRAALLAKPVEPDELLGEIHRLLDCHS